QAERAAIGVVYDATDRVRGCGLGVVKPSLPARLVHVDRACVESTEDEEFGSCIANRATGGRGEGCRGAGRRCNGLEQDAAEARRQAAVQFRYVAAAVEEQSRG